MKMTGLLTLQVYPLAVTFSIFRCNTDIMMAGNCGLHSLLVLTGTTLYLEQFMKILLSLNLAAA